MKRSLAAYEAGRALAVQLGQDPLEPRGTFTVHSKSRQGRRSYLMQHTPEGYAVHQGEGCEGELFKGPLGCWHSKQFSVNREEIEDMSNAVVPYQGGAIAEVREFNDSDIETLKATICKGASDAELKLFVATCQHTGLDPFMRQIHAVMRRSQVNGQWVSTMTIQIGIDGYRLVAQRTGQMEGMDGPVWTYDGETWHDLPLEGSQPIAAKCAVWRKGVERPYVGVARWSAYVQTTSGGQPNSMWTKMGPEMLAKCAEALALRRAFPAEMAALPQRIDFIDPDAIEMERQDWTPQQVRDQYVIEHGIDPREDDDTAAPEPPHDNPAHDGPDEHEDAQQVPVSASAGDGGPSPATTPVASSSPALDPVVLLNEISLKHGIKGKQAAIAVMSRLYDTTVITKLSDDDRADYAGILKVRLDGVEHEHEGKYTAQGVPVCGVCGDEVAVPAGV